MAARAQGPVWRGLRLVTALVALVCLLPCEGIRINFQQEREANIGGDLRPQLRALLQEHPRPGRRTGGIAAMKAEAAAAQEASPAEEEPQPQAEQESFPAEEEQPAEGVPEEGIQEEQEAPAQADEEGSELLDAPAEGEAAEEAPAEESPAQEEQAVGYESPEAETEPEPTQALEQEEEALAPDLEGGGIDAQAEEAADTAPVEAENFTNESTEEDQIAEAEPAGEAAVALEGDGFAEEGGAAPAEVAQEEPATQEESSGDDQNQMEELTAQEGEPEAPAEQEEPEPMPAEGDDFIRVGTDGQDTTREEPHEQLELEVVQEDPVDYPPPPLPVAHPPGEPAAPPPALPPLPPNPADCLNSACELVPAVAETYNVYLKKEKKGRGTPEGGLPVLHIGYKSCGFMQKMRDLGITTVGVDPWLMQDLDNQGVPLEAMNPTCEAWYNMEQLTLKPLTQLEAGEGTFGLVVVTHVLERKPLNQIDRVLTEIGLSTTDRAIIVISAFSDEEDTSEYPPDLPILRHDRGWWMDRFKDNGFTEDTASIEPFRDAMRRTVHKRHRNGGVFLLRKAEHKMLKYQARKEELDHISHHSKYGGLSGTSPVTRTHDAEGTYVVTRPVKTYAGDPYYERLKMQHPSRNGKSVVEVHKEELKAQKAGKAPAGYSTDTWKVIKKANSLKELKYKHQEAAITDLKERVVNRKKEDIVQGLKSVKEHDARQAQDLVRLEAEAAGVKAIIDRRRAEIASRSGHIARKKGGIQSKEEVGRLTESLTRLQGEYGRLHREIVGRAGELANRQSTAVLQHRARAAQLGPDADEFDEALQSIRARKEAELVDFKRPVRTWTEPAEEAAILEADVEADGDPGGFIRRKSIAAAHFAKGAAKQGR